MKGSELFRAIWLAAVCALVAMLVVGCNEKNDAVLRAENADKINLVAVPSIAETESLLNSLGGGDCLVEDRRDRCLSLNSVG